MTNVNILSSPAFSWWRWSTTLLPTRRSQTVRNEVWPQHTQGSLPATCNPMGRPSHSYHLHRL